MALVGEQTLDAVDSLSSTLALIVTTNLEQASTSLGDLTASHVTAVEAFKKEAMAPTLDIVSRLGSQMSVKLAAMQSRLRIEVSGCHCEPNKIGCN